ncbi:4-hydroxythreonine-4-phosphate dehydrogenase PdxA [Bacteroides sp. 224]|uniref:4-hydroxythreonine-4-phosphate dehydrogenase PdxA n=1 Tax=Bacteroides sp. 224 TaxID=2302936 RepID=UPI0013D75E05|nr:4-hydroxythreonine-4-phosphate dehydrogenase PdxA [Bacteroides sp. 224]NDV64255.1 4-hydroxythreonine-4-phosphate dehydrogenase PdxA [Bacteroides sp. 224]
MKKPILAITMGDPAGIGPEIIVKALHQPEVYQKCRPLVVGDAAVMQKAIKVTELPMSIHVIHQVSDALFAPNTIDVYDLNFPKLDQILYGKVSAQAGDAAFQSIKKAIELAMNKEVDGTVTAPINKEALNLAGHHFDGHTEIYAHFTQTAKYAMLLADEFLRVIHVSTHVSLREACDRVKKDRIIDVTQLIADACQQFGIKNPRIGIAGLNPHSSDNGLFGWEEEKEIIPAVNALKEMGYHVEGPVPPDTLFAKAKCGQYDGCVAMYHDQGHIPFKVVGFNWDPQTGKMESVQGVNITLGLPIIRVSVDHGTAFDVAGKGIASPDAMLLSIDYATRMANNKNTETQKHRD